MKQLIRFFLLALVAISFVFSANLLFAADVVTELANKQFMLFNGNVSKTTKKHSLVEFRGKETGRYLFVKQKDDGFCYEIKGDFVALFKNGDTPSIYSVNRQCVNENCIIYLRNPYNQKVVFSLISPPQGYEKTIEARSLFLENRSKNKKEVIYLLTKALEEAFSELPNNYSDILVYKISEYLMGLDSFTDARNGFLAINEREKAAEATIQMIVNGANPQDVDVEKTAALAWSLLDSPESSYNTKTYYAAAEAIAYACAKMGEYGLAKKYADTIFKTAKAQDDMIFGRDKIREAGINLPRLANLAVTYGDKHQPDNFRASVNK